ncbi:Superoxide dismutase 1 copper chaperone [Trichoderma lentiforme]|uniref:Superoxide dismutase 1 copper chaperone n=1 Tax=Trichoderma lentiforme TaxID=1567552 RepID=A0A9P4X663_9HYPO|nr:Superoxide dismutase 1 copper chaperone [Trichoderma lentiforme]
MALRNAASSKILAASFGLFAGYSAYRYRASHSASPASSAPTPGTMAVKHSFQTLFAVPLSCDGCVKSVSDSLYKLDGITKVEGNLKDQLVSVEGSGEHGIMSMPLHGIISTHLLTHRAMPQSHHRPSLRPSKLRGETPSFADPALPTVANTDIVYSGAAVSILETFADQAEHHEDDTSREVRGLARMVQVSPDRTLIDLTIRGVAPGTYRATIREFGDLKDGAESTGPIWSGGEKEEPKGSLGIIEVSKDGRGSAFVDHAFQIWEVIGHAMVLTRQDETQPLKNDDNTVVGVIARSAGMWDNDKTVCSCTGKTLWEEREDEVKKGML